MTADELGDKQRRRIEAAFAPDGILDPERVFAS